MLVETFEMTEVIEGSDRDEVSRLHDKLGLDRQKELKGLPFAEMNKEECFVYHTLCPESKTLSEYRQSTIPLRVLQIIELAQDSGFFTEIVIWDRVSSMMITDPIAIGIKREGYNYHYFALARWGKELDTYTTLLHQALQTKKVEVIAKCKEIMGKIKSRLEYLAGEVNSIEEVKIPTLYD